MTQAVVGYLAHYKKTILAVEATEFLCMSSRTNVRDLVLHRIRSLTFVRDDMKLLTRVYLDFSLCSFFLRALTSIVTGNFFIAAGSAITCVGFRSVICVSATDRVVLHGANLWPGFSALHLCVRLFYIRTACAKY